MDWVRNYNRYYNSFCCEARLHDIYIFSHYHNKLDESDAKSDHGGGQKGKLIPKRIIKKHYSHVNVSDFKEDGELSSPRVDW